MAYQFPDIAINANGKMPFGYLRMYMDEWQPGDPLPTFSTPTAATYNPLQDIPSFVLSAEPEAGAFGIESIDLEFNNLPYYGAFTIRGALSSHPFDLVQWFKFEWSTDGVSFTEIFRGLVDAESVQGKDPSLTLMPVLKFKVKVISYLSYFEQKTVLDFITTKLLLATYNIIPTSVVICYPDSGLGIVSATLNRFVQLDDISINQWRNDTDLRFFKITDIVQAASEYLGVSATATFDCDWVFTIHDGVNPIDKSFADLRIVSQTVGTGGAVEQQYGFFDIDKKADCSLYGEGSVLELLKAVLQPFGMEARFELNAGALRLKCVQLEIDEDVTPDTALWQKPGVDRTPSERIIYGMKTVVPGAGEFIQGTAGDGAIALKCIYMSLNGVGATDEWTKGFNDVRWTEGLIQSLYAEHNGSMYSVYSITPKTRGTGTASYAYDYKDRLASFVVAAAMNNYFFNQSAKSTVDPVGIYRYVMRAVEGAIADIDLTMAPGKYITLGGYTYWIRKVDYDIKNGKTKLALETNEW